MSPLARSAFAAALLALTGLPAAGAIVRGSVTAAEGPLRGAVVASYDAAGLPKATATTDAAGQYTLTLPAGRYRLLAWDPTGAHATVFYGNAESFENSTLVQLVEDMPLTASFVLPPAGSLSGIVSAGGEPLQGAVVEVYNLSGTRRGSTTTRASGAYSLVLPAGDYKLFAYDTNDAFAGSFATGASAFADAATFHVEPPSATTVSWSLPAAARIRGTLVDGATQLPLAEKLAYVYTAAGSLVSTKTTAADGSFAFTLPPGSYRLVAADPARMYATVFYAGSRSFEHSSVVSVAADEVRSLTLRAERGGIVSGHVTAGTKTEVIAFNTDGTRHASATTTAAGDYALVVAPGTCRVAVTDPDGQYATQFYPAAQSFSAAADVVVFAGQTRTGIDFAPARAGRFSGTIRDAASGQTLSGMTVLAFDLAGNRVGQTTSSQAGTYRLALPAGTCRLLAADTRLEYATAYATGANSYETTPPLTVAAGEEQTAGFTMSRGVRVTGTVVEEHGATVDSIEVFALNASGNRVGGAMTSAAGTFALVVQSGTYTLVARDPYHRYAMRGPGTPIAVGTAQPAAVTLRVTSIRHRRAVRS